MNNIDKFDILTGKILAKLYETFPVKTSLLPEDFGIKDVMREFLNGGESEAADTAELEFFAASVSWLLENEIIVAKKGGLGIYYECGLSFKGLRLLKAVPPSVDSDRKSIGESLCEFAKAGFEGGLKKAVGALIVYAGAWVKNKIGG